MQVGLPSASKLIGEAQTQLKAQAAKAGLSPNKMASVLGATKSTPSSQPLPLATAEATASAQKPGILSRIPRVFLIGAAVLVGWFAWKKFRK